MKKVLFIINPQSGTNREKQLQTAIDANLDLDKFTYSIKFTEHPKHGKLLAKEAVKNNFEIIMAVGGDGSVNDVINGLYGTSTVLGIIPMGSGNGSARNLNIPLTLHKAIRLINRQHTEEIHLGTIEGYIFLSSAGVGFDTVVTKKFKKSQHRGFWSYIKIILKHLKNYNPYTWQVTIDGNKKEIQAFMLSAANGKQIGYGFTISPHAELSDEYFNLVCIHKFPLIFTPYIALLAIMKKIHKSRYVSIEKAKHIHIHHPQLKQVQIDGEAVSCSNSISIKMLSSKMKVLVP